MVSVRLHFTLVSFLDNYGYSMVSYDMIRYLFKIKSSFSLGHFLLRNKAFFFFEESDQFVSPMRSRVASLSEYTYVSGCGMRQFGGCIALFILYFLLFHDGSVCYKGW